MRYLDAERIVAPGDVRRPVPRAGGDYRRFGWGERPVHKGGGKTC